MHGRHPRGRGKPRGDGGLRIVCGHDRAEGGSAHAGGRVGAGDADDCGRVLGLRGWATSVHIATRAVSPHTPTLPRTLRAASPASGASGSADPSACSAAAAVKGMVMLTRALGRDAHEDTGVPSDVASVTVTTGESRPCCGNAGASRGKSAPLRTEAPRDPEQGCGGEASRRLGSQDGASLDRFSVPALPRLTTSCTPPRPPRSCCGASKGEESRLSTASGAPALGEAAAAAAAAALSAVTLIPSPINSLLAFQPAELDVGQTAHCITLESSAIGPSLPPAEDATPAHASGENATAAGGAARGTSAPTR